MKLERIKSHTFHDFLLRFEIFMAAVCGEMSNLFFYVVVVVVYWVGLPAPAMTLSSKKCFLCTLICYFTLFLRLHFIYEPLSCMNGRLFDLRVILLPAVFLAAVSIYFMRFTLVSLHI